MKMKMKTRKFPSVFALNSVMALAVVVWSLLPSPALAQWINEPAGSQVVADCDFNDGSRNCGGKLQTYYPGGGVVNMPDAPYSPSGVYYNALRNGSSTGDGSQLTFTGSRNMKDMYVGFYWKMSSDFEGYSNGTNKLFFMRDFGNPTPGCNTNGIFLIGGQDGIDGRNWPWSIFWGTNTGGYSPGEPNSNEGNPSCSNWTGGYLCYPNASSPQLWPNTWYLIEAYVKPSSCPNCKDGIIRWWVDGVLAGDVTNYNYGCGTVNEFVFDHTWDGQLAAQCRQDTGNYYSRDCTRDWYHYLDHLHITAPDCPNGCPVTGITIPMSFPRGPAFPSVPYLGPPASDPSPPSSPPAAGGACETPMSAGTAISKLIAEEAKMITKFETDMVRFITEDFDTATQELVDRFNEFDENVRRAIKNWWEDGYLPALKEMTKQLSTARPDQSLSMGMMEEAKGQVETQRLMQEKMVEQDRRMRTSDLMCPVATVAPALGETERMSRAVANVVTIGSSKIRRAQTGSVSEHGRGGERNAQWKVYKDNFCDPNDNNGASGCAVAGPMAGKDTDVNSLLWGEKQTIDMATPVIGAQNELLVNTALQNMLAPVSPEPIPPSVLQTAQGQREMLKRRSLEARMRTAYNVMARMIGQRTGGKPRPEAAAVRAAGLNPGDLSVVSTNPSYKELMDTMTRDRHRDPAYITKLIDNPENILREQGSIKALQLQQMNEIYKRQEELLALTAASLSHDLDRESAGDALSASPVK